MTMINKPKKLHYQQLAVVNIIRILQKQDRAVLQAPTGSGKTFIISQIIQRLLLEKNYYLKRVAFLFLAPSTGQLIHQCYTKIKTHLRKAWVRGFETCSIGTDRKNKQAFYLAGINHFKPGTVYFIGWNTLSKNSNAMRQDSERNNLIDILDNTKNQGIKLVMIIDEAHREYLQTRQQNEVSETKREFLDSAKEFTYKTIEVSATITSQDSPESIWKVTADQVRQEYAIKKFIDINDFSLEEAQDPYDSANDIVYLVEQGLAKQRKVQEAYRETRPQISQTPIMLIQIPDNMKKVAGIDVDKHYQKTLQIVLDKHSRKYGFKYGFWLSNNKSAKSREELLTDNEVIIFKQAIATGWDIPRANILVKLRNPKKGSAVFEIQTLGRILRNPLFNYYFKSAKPGSRKFEIGELINNAFVFTKDEDYKKRIDKETFVQTTKSVSYPLSTKGKNSTIKLQNMTYDDQIEDLKLHERIYQQLLEQNFIVKLVAKAQVYQPTTEMPGKQRLDVQDVVANRKPSQISMQQKIVPASTKTLFWIWLEYQEVVKKYHKLQKFMDYLIERIIHEHLITKKKLYLFFTNKFEKLFDDQSKERLSELLEKNYYEVFGKIAQLKAQKLWQLNDQKAYPVVYNDTETNKVWDKINSYQINFNYESKKVFTEPENKFYKFLKDSFDDPDNQQQVYRNGISPASDFYIPYFSSQDNTERQFYPDFILESQKAIVILDVKGGQDIEENNKFEWAWKLIDKINATGKTLIIARLKINNKVSKIKDQTVDFQTEKITTPKHLSLEEFFQKYF